MTVFFLMKLRDKTFCPKQRLPTVAHRQHYILVRNRYNRTKRFAWPSEQNLKIYLRRHLKQTNKRLYDRFVIKILFNQDCFVIVNWLQVTGIHVNKSHFQAALRSINIKRTPELTVNQKDMINRIRWMFSNQIGKIHVQHQQMTETHVSNIEAALSWKGPN